jgi:hypothetical protein
MRTERVDLRDPRAGRTGREVVDVADVASAFSLSSSDCSAPDLTSGEAGMVLSRFFSPRPAPMAVREDDGGIRGRGVIVLEVREEDGVAVTVFRTPRGLAVDVRDEAVVGAAVVPVRRAGVADTVGFVTVDARSVDVDGARDMRFGLAEMPSLVFSPASPSTVLSDSRFLCVATVVADDVLGVLRTVDGVIVGRAGGLFNELPVAGLIVEDVAEGLVAVEIRGAMLILDAGFDGVAETRLVFSVVVSSFLSISPDDHWVLGERPGH